MARFACCNSAALVSGMASKDLPLQVNICFLAEFTVVSALPRSYIKTTYDSSIDIQSSSKLPGSVTSLAKISVTALNDFHESKAVFFTFPSKR